MPCGAVFSVFRLLAAVFSEFRMLAAVFSEFRLLAAVFSVFRLPHYLAVTREGLATQVFQPTGTV